MLSDSAIGANRVRCEVFSGLFSDLRSEHEWPTRARRNLDHVSLDSSQAIGPSYQLSAKASWRSSCRKCDRRSWWGTRRGGKRGKSLAWNSSDCARVRARSATWVDWRANYQPRAWFGRTIHQSIHYWVNRGPWARYYLIVINFYVFVLAVAL
jgi:hypothetical protein